MKRLAVRAALFALAMLATVTSVSAETLLMPKRDARRNTPVVVWGVTTLANGSAFTLDYGDGTPVQAGNVSDRSYIAFQHTYATAGNFTATLTVGGVETATVKLQVFDPALLTADANRSLGINMAIEDGLRYLWTQQTNRTDFATNAQTSWSGSYPVSYTSLVTLAFQNHGYKLPSDLSAPAGIYPKYLVRRGLNYVLASLTTRTLGNQPAGNPCIGVGADCVGFQHSQDNFHDAYTTSVAMLSIAGSGVMSKINTEVAGVTNGKTYGEILQRMANSLIWGQIDIGNSGRGGWFYGFNNGSSSDGSTVGWAYLALMDAEAAGITVPAWVKTEAAFGVTANLNNNGSFDYQSDNNPNSLNNVGMEKGGIGLQGLFFIGELSGARVDSVKNYLSARWGGANDGSWSCGGPSQNKGCGYSMFNAFKGLKLQGVTTLPGVARAAGPGAQPANDWYADYQDWLVANQSSPNTTGGGSWGSMGFSCCDSNNYIKQAVAELILSPVALVLPDEQKFSTVGLTPATNTLVEGGTHTVTAHAESTGGSPVPGATVNFTILSGPNAGLTGTGTTNSSGNATFTYTDAGPDGTFGTDLISATIGTLTSNTVEMIWTSKMRPTVTTVVCPVSVTYNGATQHPCTATVTGDGGFSQVVTPTYAANVTAGTATASASFAGNASYFPSNGSNTFVILKAVPTVNVDGYTGVYDGVAHGATGTATGVLGEDLAALLNLGASFTNVPGGTATWNFAGNVNYEAVSGTAAIVITPKPASVTPDAATKVYGSADPAFTGTLTGFLALDGVTATYARTAGETVLGGPYTIHATLAPVGVLSNYAITSNVAPFTITPKAASVTPNAATKVYGNADPVFSGSMAGFAPADGVTAVYSRTAGETVLGGPYVISATLAPAAVLSNYAVAYHVAPFTITPKAALVTANDRAKTYGDEVTFAGTEFSTAGFLAGDGVSGVTLASAGAPAAASVGSYAISAGAAVGSGLTNYAISYADGSLAVGAKAATVTANDASKTYGDTVTFAGGELSMSGFVNGDAVTSATLASAGAAASATVGSYAITASGASGSGLDNYTITYVDGSLTVGAKAATVTANNATKTYGSTLTFAGTEFATSGFVNGDAVTSATLASAGAAAGATVGSYATTASGATGSGLGNYTISYADGSLTVEKKAASVTPNAATKVYGGADPALIGTLSGFEAADGVTASYGRAAGETVLGGPYAISATLAPAAVLDNYTISYNTADFTITPKAASVTPNTATKVYGNVDPALSGSLSGFLAGDSVTASYSRTAGELVANSPYTISATLAPVAVLSNYDVTYNTAAFTITKRPTTTTLTSSATPAAVGTGITFTATIPGVPPAGTTGTVTFKEGATVLGTGTLNAAGVATFTTTALAVGPHTITATYAGDTNYLGSASNTVSVLVFAYATASGGTFVIGDLNAAVGTSVTFWGAQWEKKNSMTGGGANASFKGFANALTPAPAAAGGSWTTNPGNSSNPPATIASYIGVIVTSKVNKSGSTISGGIVRVVVVKTNAGYSDNPGHAGTGTVVAIVP